MMNEYKHFLITRFNIIQEWYGTTDKAGIPIQTDEWLEERFQLFEKYCLPSVVNQSNMNFTWFVLFNTETSQVFKDRIKLYQDKYPFFVPLYLEPFTDHRPFLCENIRSYITDEKYIITSRLDNDDAIHRKYIEMVQNQFDHQDNVFISFPEGFQFELIRSISIPFRYVENHYTSRIEHVDNLESVMVNHMIIQEHGPVSCIEVEPLWIEFVHKRNKFNDTFKSRPHYYRNLKNRLKEDFNVDVEYSFSRFAKIYLRYLLLIKTNLINSGLYHSLEKINQRRRIAADKRK